MKSQQGPRHVLPCIFSVLPMTASTSSILGTFPVPSVRRTRSRSNARRGWRAAVCGCPAGLCARLRPSRRKCSLRSRSSRPAVCCQFAHRLGFIRVQAAAMVREFRGTHVSCPEMRVKVPETHAWCARSSTHRPRASRSASVPPSRSMRTSRPVSPRRAAQRPSRMMRSQKQASHPRPAPKRASANGLVRQAVQTEHWCVRETADDVPSARPGFKVYVLPSFRRRTCNEGCPSRSRWGRPLSVVQRVHRHAPRDFMPIKLRVPHVDGSDPLP